MVNMVQKAQRHFGQVLRETRLAAGISLRKFARLVDLSPTYVSQVEQGKVLTSPTVERVRKMAEVLSADAEQWIAMAGRLPEDLPPIIQKQPQEMATFLREASGLSAEQLRKLTDQARKLKEGGKG
jgi:transcriptional regulator with XRE-family HTH domain